MELIPLFSVTSPVSREVLLAGLFVLDRNGFHSALKISEDQAWPVRARGVGASEDLDLFVRTGPHI
jgi:hypothetical protein